MVQKQQEDETEPVKRCQLTTSTVSANSIKAN